MKSKYEDKAMYEDNGNAKRVPNKSEVPSLDE